ncbi:hypothetical protein [Pyrococcus kukulkanii]|uniref:hypothetical protein n=1 Tax=Pyrococcus kukulkanii TaxID=1609559 RepID=UPI003566E1B0
MKSRAYRSVSTLNLIFSVLLFTLIGSIIRIYPNLKYSLYQGVWFPNVFFSAYYTAKYGKIFSPDLVNVTTTFSRTIYNAAHLIAYSSFYGILFNIIGINEVRDVLIFNKFVPWQGVILIPIITLLNTKLILKNIKTTTLKPTDYMLVYTASIFPSFIIVFRTNESVSETPFGYALLMLNLSLILKLLTSNNDKRIMLLLILLSIVLPMYYHSAATVYLIILCVLFMIIVTLHKQEFRNFYNYFVIYLVSFATITNYLGKSFFGSIISVIWQLLHGLQGLNLKPYGSTPAKLFNIPLWWTVLLIANGGLVVLIIFIGIVATMSSLARFSRKILYIIIASIIAVSSFLMWGGIPALLSRGLQYLTLISLIILPYIVIHLDAHKNLSINLKIVSLQIKKATILIIVILLSITSIVLYISNSYLMPTYLTEKERVAIDWYSRYYQIDSYVFTDFRIGTAPILLELYNFNGIPGYTETELSMIYEIYGSSKDTTGLLKDLSYNYIFLSREMSKKYPGILTFRTQITNIKVNFAKYHFSYNCATIYNNNDALIYYII